MKRKFKRIPDGLEKILPEQFKVQKYADRLWMTAYRHALSYTQALSVHNPLDSAHEIADEASELYYEEYFNRVGSDMTHFSNLILVIEDGCVYAESWEAPFTDEIINNLREAEFSIFIEEELPHLLVPGKMYEVRCYAGYGVEDDDWPGELYFSCVEYKVRELCQ